MLILTVTSHAQTADGFNPQTNGGVRCMALQPDGKILIGGSFTAINGVTRNRIARLNADGTLDTGFNLSVNQPVNCLALQAGGKILIGGGFTTVGGVARNYIARLNANGTLDSRFSPNAYNWVGSLAVQADGKILFGGDNGIARLNTDGTYDIAFNPATNGWVGTLAIQADGKILAGGYFTTISGLPRNYMARLNTDGTLDAGFDPNPNYAVSSLALQADGKIVIGGAFTTIGGAARNCIARLNADGTLDAGFNPGADNRVRSLAVQADGKILAGGDFTSIGGAAHNRIARLNADGTLDAGFDPSVSVSVLSLVVQPDGKILIGGEDTSMAILARLNAEGTFDTGLNPGADSTVRSLVLQADGKILVGGDFYSIGGAARPGIARLNADGTLDAGFNANFFSTTVGCIALQADGKVLVGTYGYGVVRLNANGTLDADLNPGYISNYVYSLAVQPDGKILIGGSYGVWRLNADGTPDVDFYPGYISANVYSLAVQPDGKILIGGSFTTIDGVSRNRIARLNADGTLDANFNPDASNEVYSLALQADGKILVGGSFTTISGIARNRIARLNADGSLDAGFNPNAGSAVRSFALQANGKILVGGDFSSIGGATRSRIARLNTSGTIDTTFNPSGNSNIYSLALQTDGKVLVGGDFTTTGGTARTRIARLQNNDVATQTLAVTGDSQIDWIRGGSSQQVEQVTFDVWNGSAWINQGAVTSVAGGWRITGLSLPASSWVRARARVASSSSNGSFIILEQIVSYGSGSLPDIAVSIDGSALSSGNATVDFGSVDWANWANSGIQKTVTISNNGNAPLNGIALAVTGTDAADFAVTVAGATTLSPGESTIFTVQFSPHGGGNRRATLSIASNDGDESPFTVSCMGTGIYQDPNFNPNASALVQTLGLQTDGKILIGGAFTTIGGVTRNRIARLNANGSLDAAFDPTTDNVVNCLAVQADGKILVGGGFTTVARVARNRIARLNADGSLDNTFNPNANNSVRSLVLQTDGKILIAGDFTNIGGVACNRIARLNADGSLDVDFNPNASFNVLSLALQPDGKILMGGSFRWVGEVTRSCVARLNANGTIDTDFNPNANETVRNLMLQADGKILIGGDFTTISGVSRNRIARLNIDGTLDSDFNPGANSIVRCLALQADGKALIGGDFTSIGGGTRSCLARLNADGTLDANFNPNAGSSTSPSVYSLALQADGAILSGGSFTIIGGVARNNIARLPNNIAAVQTLAVTDPDQIAWTRGGSAPEVQPCSFDIWDGSAWVNQGTATRVASGWLMTSLSLPASGWVRARAWANGSSGLFEQIASYGAGLFPDITVTVDGIAQSSRNAAVDFGTVDWGTSGTPKTFTITNVGDAPLHGFGLTVTGPDAAEFTTTAPIVTTLASGESTTFTVQYSPFGNGVRRAILSLTSNDADELPFIIDCSGTVIHHDPGFNPSASTWVSALALQADGKILIGGDFWYVGGIARYRIARLNPDGSLDTGFNPLSPYFNNVVYCLAVQDDGKILIGGQFAAQSFNIPSEVPRNYIARLHADGTLDDSFNPNTNGHVSSLALQPDGKIIIQGGFSTIGGVARNNIARLNVDGSLDTNFNPTANSTVACMATQDDGKILIGGWFITVDGVARRSIARLNVDGTLDPDFNFEFISDGNNNVSSMVVQADGKILISGYLRIGSGGASQRIARLNADGSLDTSFDSGAISSLGSIVLQADGKMLVGGGFTTIGDVSRNRIARLNVDGSLDANFNPSANSSVSGLALQADGKILTAGFFTNIGGVARNNMARLPNNIAAIHTLAVTGTSQIDWTRGGSVQEVRQVTFDVWNESAWVSQGEATRVEGGWRMAGLSLPASSWVRARARTAGGGNNGSAGIVEQIIEYGLGDFPDIAVDAPAGNELTSGVGTVNLGTASVRTFTIRNTGAALLSNLAISHNIPTGWDFTLGSPGLLSLESGASTTFSVTFTPATMGPRYATLRITSNDPDEDSFAVSMVGNGGTAQQVFDAQMAAAGLSGLNAAPGEMPYKDGVSNLLKYAFNMNVTKPDVRILVPGSGSEGLPVMYFVPGVPAMIRYEFIRRKNSGLRYSPLQSSDLTSWTPMYGDPKVTPINAVWERMVFEQVHQIGSPQFLKMQLDIE